MELTTNLRPEFIWADIRYGWRQLLKSPGSSFITILTLAFGIGANTAVFTLTWNIVLNSLPVPHPEQLVEYDMRKGEDVMGLSGPEFAILRKRQQASSDLMAWNDDKVLVRNGTISSTQTVEFLSDGANGILEIRPQIGQFFSDVEANSEDTIPAILGYRFWKSQFAGSDEALGKVLSIEDHPVTVVGVMPAGFEGLTANVAPAIYLPMSFEAIIRGPSFLNHPGKFKLFALGRLRPDSSLRIARNELDTIQPSLRQQADPTGIYLNQFFRDYKIVANTGSGGMSALRVAYQRPLLILEILAICALALCCINTALVMMARVSSRKSEYALRSALGSSRGRLVRQVLVETTLLSLPGLVGGVLLGWLAASLLINLLGSDTTLSASELQPNFVIMCANVFATALVAAGAGLWPAVRASWIPPSVELKGSDNRSTSQQLGGWIIVVQVAISLTLVVTAAVLGGTLSRLLTLDSGFQPDHAAIAIMDLQRLKLTTPQEVELTDRFLRSVQAQAGVVSAGYIGDPPVSGATGTSRMFSLDRDRNVHTDTKLYFQQATAGYFSAAGTRILSGNLRVSPESGTANCAINASLAKFFFPHEPPLGNLIYVSTWPQPDGTNLDIQSACRVTAIVEDVRFVSLREPVSSIVYEIDAPATTRKYYDPSGVLVVRGQTTDLATAAIHSAASTTLPTELDLKVRTFQEQVNQDLRRERILVSLSGAFAVLAILLTGLGLYGVLMQSVSSRTREIGLRVALGSSRRALLASLLRPIMIEIGVGLAFGIIGSEFIGVAANRVLQVSAPGVSTLILCGGVIAFIAALSAAVPMRRALQVDPVRQLKAD